MEVALRAAQSAGQVIREAWTKPRQVLHKSTYPAPAKDWYLRDMDDGTDHSPFYAASVDLVTETDKQCEALIYDLLRQSFPDHAFIGEEGSAAQGFTDSLSDAPTWMVDPVDGMQWLSPASIYLCVQS